MPAPRLRWRGARQAPRFRWQRGSLGCRSTVCVDTLVRCPRSGAVRAAAGSTPRRSSMHFP
eukprot:2209424-Lingulodinium_polyedra.AAC.1